MPETRLIVGIGNPGAQYADTRHNAGIWFVERLGGQLRKEKKFHGRLADVQFAGVDLRVLIPDTYMNESGRSVGAVASYYKIPAAEILVAHDEIDFPIGVVRFKQGGGLAGHNGLRSITAALASDQSFCRLRIGVGHPGDKQAVKGHVLSKTPKVDRDNIEACIDAAVDALPAGINGDWQRAMNQLHNFKLEE